MKKAQSESSTHTPIYRAHTPLPRFFLLLLSNNQAPYIIKPTVVFLLCCIDRVGDIFLYIYIYCTNGIHNILSYIYIYIIARWTSPGDGHLFHQGGRSLWHWIISIQSGRPTPCIANIWRMKKKSFSFFILSAHARSTSLSRSITRGRPQTTKVPCHRDPIKYHDAVCPFRSLHSEKWLLQHARPSWRAFIISSKMLD